jgi:hypothetical protein
LSTNAEANGDASSFNTLGRFSVVEGLYVENQHNPLNFG